MVSRLMKARRPVDAVPIEHRQRRMVERRRAFDQRLGRGRGFEKRERGRGMQLDVHESSFALFSPNDQPQDVGV